VEAPGVGGEAGAEEGIAGEGVGFGGAAGDVFEVGGGCEEGMRGRWGVGTAGADGGEAAESEFDGVSAG
jgi:hypothetical protein